jgi:hypothetical protein
VIIIALTSSDDDEPVPALLPRALPLLLELDEHPAIEIAATAMSAHIVRLPPNATTDPLLDFPVCRV